MFAKCNTYVLCGSVLCVCLFVCVCLGEGERDLATFCLHLGYGDVENPSLKLFFFFSFFKVAMLSPKNVFKVNGLPGQTFISLIFPIALKWNWLRFSILSTPPSPSLPVMNGTCWWIQEAYSKEIHMYITAQQFRRRHNRDLPPPFCRR